MQENIYTAQDRKIVGQSLLIWFFLLLEIPLIICTIFQFENYSVLTVFIIINLILLTVNITSVKLLRSYKKHSEGKKLVITYNEIKMIDQESNTSITLKSSEISRIELHRCGKGNNFPWYPLHYFSLHDNQENRIVVTSWILDISDFWQDTLTRKVSRAEVIVYEDNVPRIE